MRAMALISKDVSVKCSALVGPLALKQKAKLRRFFFRMAGGWGAYSKGSIYLSNNQDIMEIPCRKSAFKVK